MNKRFLLGLLLGAGLIWSLAYWQPAWLGLPQPAPGPATAADEADSGTKQREILYWEAPMDPSYRRDEPGKSPMGMDLVPVYADQAQQAGLVEIDPGVVNQLGVRTAEVTRRTLTRQVRAVGNVTYNQRRMSHVHTRVAGWVETLYIDAAGEAVAVDDPILTIYAPDLLTAQEEYLAALRRADGRAGGEHAPDLVALARQRLKLLGVSEREIERIRRTGELRSEMTLRAPHAGVVTDLKVQTGMHVTAEDNLYHLADLRELWVLIDLYEDQAGWVEPGAAVTLTLPYLPGRRWTGQVDFLYPYLNTAARTVQARLVLANLDGQLKPGMYATAEIAAEPHEDVLAIPEQALIATGERQVVMTALGEGRFQPVAVTPGLRSEGWIEIRAGLHAGDRVVTSGQFLLDGEADFEAAMQRMQGDASTDSADQNGAAGAREHARQSQHGGHGHHEMPKQNGPSNGRHAQPPAAANSP